MATYSEVKTNLDRIAAVIDNTKRTLAKSKNAIAYARAELGNVPTVYSDTIDTVNGFAPTGAVETLAKDELSKLTVDFLALRDAAQDAETYLNTITEF